MLTCAFELLDPRTGKINEPVHEKTSKWHVRPAKTQISLGICPV